MRAIDSTSAPKRADELFHAGWNCAESVFVAIHEQVGEGEAPAAAPVPTAAPPKQGRPQASQQQQQQRQQQPTPNQSQSQSQGKSNPIKQEIVEID